MTGSGFRSIKQLRLANRYQQQHQLTPQNHHQRGNEERSMRKIIRLNTHPYPTKVWFTADVEAFQRHRTKITGREPEEVGVGQCSATDDRGTMVIGVFDGDTSTLVHEVGHAVVNVFHYVGMDINLHTTEAFSYLLDSLYSQANQHLNKSTPAHDGLRTESETN